MADYLYLFTVNARFPEPIEEISFLAALAEAGEPVHLLLTDRPAPPLSAAEAGTEVLLCTRRDDTLQAHGLAVIAARASKEPSTPPAVEPLYGELHDRMFARIESLRFFAASPVEDLDADETREFLSGQAYVKALDGRATKERTSGAIVQPITAIKPVARPSLRPVEPLDGAMNVIGLDPTAGLWSERLERGPKPMRSVTLTVSPAGKRARLAIAAGGVRSHTTNREFLDAAAALSVATVCIDGPCATSGLELRADRSGWADGSGGATREAERRLAREGIGLYWTTRNTVAHFDGASRWMARSLVLFAEAATSLPRASRIETHPHGAFKFLRRALVGDATLAPKSTAEGRLQRLDLLGRLIDDLDPAALPDHDAVDAACAALVAALYTIGYVKPYGDAAGGLIWMPDFPTDADD